MMTAEKQDNEEVTTQQVTAPTHGTKPNTKNPERVAAGRLVAERTRLAREAQKKSLAEANVIIEKKNKADKAAAKAANKAISKDEPTIPEEPEPAQQHPALTTGQWIGIAAIVVSLVTSYVKREDLKALLKRYTTTKPPPDQQTPQQQQPAQNQCNDLPTMD